MNTVGETIGSIMPEIYDEELSDEDEESDFEEVDPEDCPEFVRYSGNDQNFTMVNEAVDRWDSWVPQNPTEQMLKKYY